MVDIFYFLMYGLSFFESLLEFVGISNIVFCVGIDQLVNRLNYFFFFVYLGYWEVENKGLGSLSKGFVKSL